MGLKRQQNFPKKSNGVGAVDLQRLFSYCIAWLLIVAPPLQKWNYAASLCELTDEAIE